MFELTAQHHELAKGLIDPAEALQWAEETESDALTMVAWAKVTQVPPKPKLDPRRPLPLPTAKKKVAGR